VRLLATRGLQGYLAHKKQRPPSLTRNRAVSYERGTPYRLGFAATRNAWGLPFRLISDRSTLHVTCFGDARGQREMEAPLSSEYGTCTDSQGQILALAFR